MKTSGLGENWLSKKKPKVAQMAKFRPIWSHYPKISIILTLIINRDVLATQCHGACPQPISLQASFVHGQLVNIVD